MVILNIRSVRVQCVLGAMDFVRSFEGENSRAKEEEESGTVVVSAFDRSHYRSCFDDIWDRFEQEGR